MAVVNLLSRLLHVSDHAHVVVAVVRNEMLRLPFLVSYYREQGFDTFIFIDNDSSDGTREFLLAQPNTMVLAANEEYSKSGFGLAWVNAVLHQFCVGRWVLVVDADELLVWPHSEHETIADLTRRLDASGSEVLFTILLDMYSDRAFGEIGYVPGTPFIEYSRFFEGPYQLTGAKSFPYRQLYGGVRARAFGMLEQDGVFPPTVSKVPLVKWRAGQHFVLSTHGLHVPMALAPMRGALLHFKMFDDLIGKCRIEVERGQHFQGGQEYRWLGTVIDRLPARTFYRPDLSRPYVDSAGLLAVGLLDVQKPF